MLAVQFRSANRLAIKKELKQLRRFYREVRLKLEKNGKLKYQTPLLTPSIATGYETTK